MAASAPTGLFHAKKKGKPIMALPNMGLSPRYLEELRIGGGYQSTPDGGVDMDKQGNIALDGDLTVGGALAVAGANKSWNAFVPALEIRNITAANVVTITILGGRVYLPVMDFNPGVDQGACCVIALPAQYDGSALTFTLYWTATAGSAGDVRWIINAGVFADNENLALDVASAGVVDTFLGANRLHACAFSMTPTGAASGNLLTVYLRRLGSNAQDTFDADARLIALQVAYA